MVVSNGNTGPQSTWFHLHPLFLCYYIVLLHCNGKRKALQSERSELQPFLALFYLAFFLNLKVGLITLSYYSIYDDEMR